MGTLLRTAACAIVTAAVLVACAVTPGAGEEGEVDDATAEAAVVTSEVEGRKCYCTGAARCTSSRSVRYMFPDAAKAMAAAGVSASALIQTFGDAPASVGTHCPEPGTTYSAATDMQEGADACARTRALRLRGFAAWFRTAPEFPGNLHIHAVYPVKGMKASLVSQVDSFLARRNALRSNRIETHCPITAEEVAAVSAVVARFAPRADAGAPAVDASVDASPDDGGTGDGGAAGSGAPVSAEAERLEDPDLREPGAGEPGDETPEKERAPAAESGCSTSRARAGGSSAIAVALALLLARRSRSRDRRASTGPWSCARSSPSQSPPP
jgi:hypothetical protein